MIVETIIDFKNPVLFLEFFVRDYVYSGRGTIRTTLPSGAFFYTGQSKAIGYKEKVQSPLLGFENGIPFLSNNISESMMNKIFNKNTNIVASILGESVDKQNIWWRKESRLISNKTNIDGNKGQLPYHNFKSLAPYSFNILNMDDNESVETNFPRKEVTLSIEKGQTLCFLCRQDERGDGEWYSPNVNLVLFVKNYGLFDKIAIRPQSDIDRMVNNMLCKENFDLRDFRKSSLNFELG